MFSSYVAIGDSFTEGLGDWFEDGEPRGWADRVAEALAIHANRAEQPNPEERQPFEYANLAIRGRKLPQIVEEQIEPAVSQKPDLVSLNAGGNDILRPNFDSHDAVKLLLEAVEQIRRADIHVLLLAGPDPSGNLPLGKVFHQRAEAFTDEMVERAEVLENVTVVDNFHDREFEETTYWSDDGLHLSSPGHLRVAANVLDGLALPYPEHWGDPRAVSGLEPKSYRSLQYLNRHVVPWIGRRLTGRSSGDGRQPKRPLLQPM